MIQTLDPIVESSLLQTRADGTRTFVHDTLKDYFLAQKFAGMISTGVVTIGDIVHKYLTYEEKPERWGLPEQGDWRGIYPDFKTMVVFLSSNLHETRCVELLEELTRSHRESLEHLDNKEYMPFGDDMAFAEAIKVLREEPTSSQEYKEKMKFLFGADIHSISMSSISMSSISSFKRIRIKPPSKSEKERTIKINMELNSPSIHLLDAGYIVLDPVSKLIGLMSHSYYEVRHAALGEILRRGYGGCEVEFADALVNMLEDDDPPLILSAKYTLIKSGLLPYVSDRYNKLVRLLHVDDNLFITRAAIKLMGHSRDYHPRLSEFLDDDTNCSLCLETLSAQGRFDPRMLTLLQQEKEDICYSAAEALVNLGYYNPVIEEFLLHPSPKVRGAAITVLTGTGNYTEKLVIHLSDSDKDVRGRTAVALIDFAKSKDMAEIILHDIRKVQGIILETDYYSFMSRLHDIVRPSGYMQLQNGVSVK